MPRTEQCPHYFDYHRKYLLNMSAVEATKPNDELILAISCYNMLEQLEMSLKLNNVTLKNFMAFRDQLIQEESSEEHALGVFNTVIGRFVVCVFPKNGKLYILDRKVDAFPTPDTAVQLNCNKKGAFKFEKQHSSSKRYINNRKGLRTKKAVAFSVGHAEAVRFASAYTFKVRCRHNEYEHRSSRVAHGT